MRKGVYDEAELERQLQNRGFMYRFFGRWMKSITHEWQMYPVGVVFGMGFDTATEVALLATTALLASQHLPFYAILCLPILFTAGMTLMDTLDGDLHELRLLAGRSSTRSARSITTSRSRDCPSAICFFIGTIEVLGLLPREIGGLHGGFWHEMVELQHQ